MKILKFSPKLMLYTSKESSEHVKCRFRLKKYDLLLKKWEKISFEKKNFKGGDPLKSERSKKKKFPFFKFSKIFFEKWPQWDVSNVERNKVIKYELNRSVH